MKRYLLPIAITVSAAAISLSAAFYSVSGLSKLFAGAGIAVTIMAAALEASKLVIASMLYRYRSTLPRGLKIYFSTAIVVLMIITSAGIYGLLSAGYQKTADKLVLSESTIATLESKKQLFVTQQAQIDADIKALSTNQSNVTGAIGSSVTTVTDRRGKSSSQVNASQQRLIDRQLTKIEARQEKLESRRDVVTDSIASIDQQIYNAKNRGDITDELGPLMYISKLTGYAMDTVINWFLLLIIFVFDPLAIALVIAANMAFEKLNETEPKPNPIQEEPITEPEPVVEIVAEEPVVEIVQEEPEHVVVHQEPDAVIEEPQPEPLPEPMPERFDPEKAKWMDAKTRASYMAKFQKK